VNIYKILDFYDHKCLDSAVVVDASPGEDHPFKIKACYHFKQ